MEVVKRFFQAYNEVDVDSLRLMLSDDLYFEHHNRFKGNGKEALLNPI